MSWLSSQTTQHEVSCRTTSVTVKYRAMSACVRPPTGPPSVTLSQMASITSGIVAVRIQIRTSAR